MNRTLSSGSYHVYTHFKENGAKNQEYTPDTQDANFRQVPSVVKIMVIIGYSHMPRRVIFSEKVCFIGGDGLLYTFSAIN